MPGDAGQDTVFQGQDGRRDTCLEFWLRLDVESLHMLLECRMGDAVPAGLDPKVVAVYKGVGEILRRYTTGRIPKAFKVPPLPPPGPQ